MGELISAIKPNFKNRSGFGAFSRKTALTKAELKNFGYSSKLGQEYQKGKTTFYSLFERQFPKNVPNFKGIHAKFRRK